MKEYTKTSTSIGTNDNNSLSNEIKNECYLNRVIGNYILADQH